MRPSSCAAKLSVVTIAISLVMSAFLETQAADSNYPLDPAIIKRDPALMITPQALLKKLETGNNVVILDVRRQVEFERIRIPGSLNMPLYAIKTKQFLKEASLVILNQGGNYRSLETEGLRLITAYGFRDVKVLYGGLNSWQKTGGQLIGLHAASDKADSISPQDYYLDRNYDDWLLINVSSGPESESDNFLNASTRLPFFGEGTDFAAKLEELIKDSHILPPPYILMFNTEGEDYDQVRKVVNKTGLAHVFFLEGGLNGYESYVKKLALLWRPEKKKVGGCGTCP